ncbi:MAG: hypothetical protein MJY84_02040 [Bacteroidales bacterium]|nr:hypothetical protein [Bacteroidales bacterium]
MQPFLDHVDVEAGGVILEGSYTNKAIKVNQVTVDEFDPGFVDGSGNVIPFQDISFE